MYGHAVQTTATSCSHKFYTFKMAVPLPSNQCPWFCTPPPTSSPSSLYVLASANKRGKKTESVIPPQTCLWSHEADDGVSTPKTLIRLASTGLLGREGLRWVFEDEQELGRRWQKGTPGKGGSSGRREAVRLSRELEHSGGGRRVRMGTGRSAK